MRETAVGLLDRLRVQADSRSWEHFVHLYKPLLYGWLRRYAVRQQDADDIVQEILAVVARELPSFHHNQRRGAFRRWLRIILVNRLRNFRRQRRQDTTASNSGLIEHLADQLEDPKSSLTRQFDLEHDIHVIHRALALIEPEFRPRTWVVVRQLMLEDAEPEAVAAELKMTVDAVYTTKSRVMKRLRQVIRGFID